MENSFNNNFISSIDNEEEHVMHSKSDDIEILINDEANEVIKELFGSLKKRYQNHFGINERWWVCLGLCSIIIL